MDELKEHLRQDHGIHETPAEVATGADDAGPSYGPDISPAELDELHENHHAESADMLRHSHDGDG